MLPFCASTRMFVAVEKQTIMARQRSEARLSHVTQAALVLQDLTSDLLDIPILRVQTKVR